MLSLEQFVPKEARVSYSGLWTSPSVANSPLSTFTIAPHLTTHEWQPYLRSLKGSIFGESSLIQVGIASVPCRLQFFTAESPMLTRKLSPPPVPWAASL